jgi:ubiquinone/menaquinone biosynthesis C-methylase UbiE
MKTSDYFSGLAGVYDANRPSYPVEAINATLEGLPRPVVVADIGCGTGISSRLLAACGAKVIGIDPNADMLGTARTASQQDAITIDYRLGTGEQTGLADASVDVVVCAQAFHWLKAADALREFHRMLKPGGRAALIWNVRDDDHDAFTIAYSDIARRSMANARANGLETHDLRSADPTVGGFFDDAMLRVFPNPHRLTWEGLLGRARSASYFPRPGDPMREKLERELESLFKAHARDGVVTLWHRTEVTTATRADQ